MFEVYPIVENSSNWMNAIRFSGMDRHILDDFWSFI
jgi:hypothetical protein